MLNNILAEMTRIGLNRSDISKMLKISTTTFRKKIRGASDFKASELEQLVAIFGGDTSIEYLLREGAA